MKADDTPFDATLRAHHAAALAHLSPRVRAQLAQRRNAALRGASATGPRRSRLPIAVAGFAALFALALGLRLPLAPAGTDAPVPPAIAALATAPAGTPSTPTLLDEDPEFYAWLASPDARLVAME